MPVVRAAAAIMILAGSAAFAVADPAMGPNAVTIAAPTRVGAQAFIVADPAAAQCPAWRVEARRVNAEAGYTITSRVIVRTDDPASLALAVRTRQATATTRPAAVRGFTIIETPSVADAVTLANELRGVLGDRVELDIERPRDLRGTLPNDPLFPNQWHLLNTSNPIADVNAEAAWALGYTGQGVIVGVTEGGFQITHPDLAPHYNAEASQGGGNSSHATSCAGVFGAVGNNSLGVTGLAYNCEVSSQLYGSGTQTAAAMVFRNDLNDIKNDSWGPSDNGRFWDDYISSAEVQALQDCAELGRGGLGTITCWAAGNGGTNDRCDYDPYVSNRYVMGIGAIGDLDHESSFNETGSSMLVVAHTSGNVRGITTTTSGSSYTSSFGGTSSASPLGCGAVALALEANPLLTWRDVQALLIESARMCDPTDADWTTNAAGYEINQKFGFGAIEAADLVTAAVSWTNLAPEVSAATGTIAVNAALPDNNPTGVTRTADIPDDIRVESVIVHMNITTPNCGDLRVVLTSPAGTESVFMTPHSDSSDDVTDFDFKSLRSWGENAAGTWTLTVSDELAGNAAAWTDFAITVYGTAISASCNAADVAPPFGVLDLADVQAFIGAFIAHDPIADIAGPDGVWDLADVQAFVAAFTAGCP
ncbi:MAG: S8 family serine peptidase [Phycisphaeraceae bacterium]|nr:MAG: S8 family serine peptidase [Phycisphaeraceae bacterium]